MIDCHGRRGIAGHDDQLDSAVDEPSYGEIDGLGHLLAGLVPVRAVLAVAVVQQRLAGQTAAQLAPYGQSAQPRVENSYRRVVHPTFSFYPRSSGGR